MVQGLLESDVVDVWHVGEGGSVDFRVSSEQFQRIKGDLPGCREVGSVEDIVRREEQQRAMQNEEFEKEWFEDYVSQKLQYVISVICELGCMYGYNSFTTMHFLAPLY